MRSRYFQLWGWKKKAEAELKEKKQRAEAELKVAKMKRRITIFPDDCENEIILNRQSLGDYPEVAAPEASRCRGLQLGPVGY